MRTLFILNFLLTAVGVCLAQDMAYSPFVEEGKVWKMIYSNEEMPDYPSYDFCYYIMGDTIIGDVECKKFYVFNESNTHETKYLMAVFEVDKKVFFIPAGMEDYYTLYDFSLPNGYSVSVTDALHPNRERDMNIMEEWYVNIGGENRRCIKVRWAESIPVEEDEFLSGWWIEGIGSEQGPLNTYLFGASGNYNYFMNCYVKDKEVFNMKDFMGAITNTNSINSPTTGCKTNEYTIMGIKSMGSRGIIIQNCKKMLIKD